MRNGLLLAALLCIVALPCATKVDTSNAVDTRPTTASPQRTITKSLPAGDDPEFRSAKGAWRGPAQFQFSMSGVRSADAHAIGRLVIELQPDGRVRGVIDEAGCKLSGLHTQFMSPASASIDVTISGCHDGRFNTRYSGHLVGNPAAKESKLLAAT